MNLPIKILKQEIERRTILIDSDNHKPTIKRLKSEIEEIQIGLDKLTIK